MSPPARPLLLPLTPLYRFALAWRERRLASGREPIRRLRYPVISIGNLSTGGAGKTPLTIALAQALTARGLCVDVLSRGYGRSSRLPAKVDPQGPAQLYGDEPLLIARAASLTAESKFQSAPAPPQVAVYVAPQRYDAGLLAETKLASPQIPPKAELAPPQVAVYVAPQRYDAGLLAETKLASPQVPPKAELAPPQVAVYVAPQRYDAGLLAETKLAPPQVPPKAELAPPQVVHILDDGFQHRQLHRDLDILLLNRDDLNDRLLPAGNLREALSAAQRADILAVPADDPTLESDLRARGLTQPTWRLHRRMQIPPEAANTPVLAFCGIARPAQFFSGLEQAGVPLAARIAFKDHHPYNPRDLAQLATRAQASGATTLLTTEKDAIRLAGLDLPLPLATVPLRTEIEDLPAALDWLLNRMRVFGGSH